MLVEIMAILYVIFIITVWVVGWIRDEKKYKVFDKEYPVGSFFYTGIKEQKFPYGKWDFLGQNQDGDYVFERVK